MSLITGSQLKSAIDRIASHSTHDYARRTNAFGDLVDVGNALPKTAKLLIHQVTLHICLQRASLTDGPLWQGGISYSRFRSPAELDNGLRKLGVTHIALVKDWNDAEDSVGGDIVFHTYVARFTREHRTIGRWTLYELPSSRPPDVPFGDVLWLGCEEGYESGLYPITNGSFTPAAEASGLVHAPREAISADDARALDSAVAMANAVAFDPECHREPLPPVVAATFVRVTVRKGLQLWVRR